MALVLAEAMLPAFLYWGRDTFGRLGIAGTIGTATREGAFGPDSDWFGGGIGVTTDDGVVGCVESASEFAWDVTGVSASDCVGKSSEID